MLLSLFVCDLLRNIDGHFTCFMRTYQNFDQIFSFKSETVSLQ